MDTQGVHIQKQNLVPTLSPLYITQERNFPLYFCDSPLSLKLCQLLLSPSLKGHRDRGKVPLNA